MFMIECKVWRKEAIIGLESIMPPTAKIATSSAVHEDQDWRLQFDTCNTLGPINHRIVPNAEP